MGKSHVRKYVMSIGYSWRKVRAENGQLSNALTLAEADEVAERRQREGFVASTAGREVLEEQGAFYVIRLIPDLAPQRIKVGFATSVLDRLATHRTVAPTAELVQSWSCRRSWERAAIAAATASDCVQVGPEVYDCQDVDGMVARCNAFFALMPTYVAKVE